ncbi:MAG: M23 family metallopeptidase [Actinobacteria bacterium]|nr:M23 family metallopeptidase [Actinomycetota bacterium]
MGSKFKILGMFSKSQLLVITGLLAGALVWLASQSQAKPLPYWRLPISPPMRITNGFAAPNPNWLPGHRGVDLSAQSGSRVFAPASGVITFADQLAGRGVVVISHGKVRSTYEPVVTDLQVGDVVMRGDEIGRIDCGVGHCCTGVVAICLHWGLKSGIKYLNPLARLDLKVILLPND